MQLIAPMATSWRQNSKTHMFSNKPLWRLTEPTRTCGRLYAVYEYLLLAMFVKATMSHTMPCSFTLCTCKSALSIRNRWIKFWIYSFQIAVSSEMEVIRGVCDATEFGSPTILSYDCELTKTTTSPPCLRVPASFVLLAGNSIWLVTTDLAWWVPLDPSLW